MAAPGGPRSTAVQADTHLQKSASMRDACSVQLPPFQGRLRIPRHEGAAESSMSLRQRVENVYAVSPSTPLLITRLPHNAYVWGDVTLGSPSPSTQQFPISSTDPDLLSRGPGATTAGAAPPPHAPNCDHVRGLLDALDGLPGSWAAISLGDRHAAGISSRGELFTWALGTANTGADVAAAASLGTAVTTINGSHDTAAEATEPQQPQPLARQAAATAATTATAPHTPLWRTPDALQRIALPAGVQVRAVSCGGLHTLAITTAGVVAWGSNHNGQCGLGDRAPAAVHKPEVIPTLRSAAAVCQLAAGRAHSLALTAASQVLSWGDCGSGQLGLGDRRSRSSPAVVEGLWALPVVQIAAGDAHSAAVTSSGHAFIWGSNRYGQLGVFPEPCVEQQQQQTPRGKTAVAAEQAPPGGCTAASSGPAETAAPQRPLGPTAQESNGRQVTAQGLFGDWRQHMVDQPQQQQHGCPMSPDLGGRSPRTPCSPHATGTPRTPNSVRRTAMRRNGRPNPQWLLAMVEMGIPPRHARVALEETGNAGVEVATEWLFAADRSAILEERSDDESPGSAATVPATAATPTRTSTATPSRLAPGHQQASHVGGCAGVCDGTSLSTSPLSRRQSRTGGSDGGGGGGGHGQVEEEEYDWTADLVVLEPRRVPLKGVRQLAAGAHHTVAVTDNGVYSWGEGGAGALGLGDGDDRDMPCRLEHFLETAEPPQEGGSSTDGTGSMYGKTALDAGPACYTRSRLGVGSCGAGSTTGTVVAVGGGGGAVAVASVASVVIQRVACGGQHTLFLAEDGSVFWCGTMPYAAIGSGSGGPDGSGGTVAGPRELQPQLRRLRGEGVTRGREADLFPSIPGPSGQGALRNIFSNLPRRLELPPPANARPQPATAAAVGAADTSASAGAAAANASSSSSSSGTCGATVAVPAGTAETKHVVYDIVTRGSISAVLMCSPRELPQVLTPSRPLLLEQLRTSIDAAAQAKQAGVDVATLSASLNAVTAGVRMVLSSPASISAAFGHRSGVGLDGELLEDVLTSIRQLFTPTRSSSRSRGEAGDDSEGVASTVAELHRYSLITALQGAVAALVDDLAQHVRLLGTPERAQVLLAALQHPLLSETANARQLLPKLVATVMTAPPVVRAWLVRWWAEYPGPLLESRLVQPLQSYLTRELSATKKLTTTLMNIIKVLAQVEEAASLSQSLPPEAFYNALISDKLDVQDHYSAWRQAQELANCRDPPREAPFSFCSYPFLLNARAKSHLMHLEARFQMEQSVAHARMEVQLYGGSVAARRRAEEGAVLVKPPTTGGGSRASSSGGAARGGSSSGCSSSNHRHRSRSGRSHVLGSSSGGSSSSSDASFRGSPSTSSGSSSNSAGIGGGGGGGMSVASLWSLFTLLRRRRRVTPSNTGGGSGGADDVGPRDQRPRTFELPSPSECPVPGVHSDMCILRVRRTHLVEDALAEVGRQARRDLFKPLRVHFIGEEGIDAGGVKKEFFALLVEQLLSPDYGMMAYDENSRTYWFNPSSLEPPESYFLLGLVLGLAVYNRVLLAFPAPLLLYQKLRGGRELGLRDLEAWQPELGRGLRQLLEYDGPEPMADVFGLTFSVDVDRFGHIETVPLKPGGELLPVTEDNRAEYVSLLAHWHMSGSVAAQFDAFATGFRVLCEGPAMSLFNAQELERLVCGNPRLDFEALRDAARYDGGYRRDSPTVKWLWEVVLQELGLEDQRAFLKFFTGSDRSPLGGLGSLRPVVQRDGPDSHKLPTAHTCFNTLLLPEYATRTKLAALLRLAINNSVGFGLQ